KTRAGATINNNDNLGDAFQILPDAFDSAYRNIATLNGDATAATLEPGETNALTALINAGVELNDNYTNAIGSNSLWWNYTAKLTRKMVTFNLLVSPGSKVA